MCRVARFALNNEQGMPSWFVRRGVAQQHMVHPIQVIVLGQHQQARRHPFADRIEAAAVLGVQCRHPAAHLLVQGVVGMAGLHWHWR
ncbi:hypothetical protein D3C71_1760110 [compost metagenome]